MTAPNPLVGEAEFRGLKLKMDFGRFCALEEMTGKKMPHLVAEFEMGLGLSDLRRWLKCLAEGDVSFDDVDAAIHQGGMMADYEAANAAIGKLMNGFFAPPKKKARPQKAE
jgi:hypothetical protein